MTESDSYGQSLEVTWPLGPTTIYGTVVMPEGAGPFPGVVLLAGSSGADRRQLPLSRGGQSRAAG